MSPADIVNKLWNYCNVLRDDGLSSGAVSYQPLPLPPRGSGLL